MASIHPAPDAVGNLGIVPGALSSTTRTPSGLYHCTELNRNGCWPPFPGQAFPDTLIPLSRPLCCSSILCLGFPCQVFARAAGSGTPPPLSEQVQVTLLTPGLHIKYAQTKDGAGDCALFL